MHKVTCITLMQYHVKIPGLRRFSPRRKRDGEVLGRGGPWTERCSRPFGLGVEADPRRGRPGGGWQRMPWQRGSMAGLRSRRAAEEARVGRRCADPAGWSPDPGTVGKRIGRRAWGGAARRSLAHWIWQLWPDRGAAWGEGGGFPRRGNAQDGGGARVTAQGRARERGIRRRAASGACGGAVGPRQAGLGPRRAWRCREREEGDVAPPEWLYAAATGDVAAGCWLEQ